MTKSIFNLFVTYDSTKVVFLGSFSSLGNATTAFSKAVTTLFSQKFKDAFFVIHECQLNEPFSENPVFTQKINKTNSTLNKYLKDYKEQFPDKSKKEIKELAFEKYSKDFENVKIKKEKKKKPLTAYIVFANEYRKKLTVEDSTSTFTDKSKLIGEKWRSMTVEEKNKFKPVTEDETEEKENKPKKKLTNYLVYCNTHRPLLKNQNAGISFSDVGKLLGKNWRDLSAEEKSKYNPTK